jgi:hypothetical protein
VVRRRAREVVRRTARLFLRETELGGGNLYSNRGQEVLGEARVLVG